MEHGGGGGGGDDGDMRPHTFQRRYISGKKPTPSWNLQVLYIVKKWFFFLLLLKVENTLVGAPLLFQPEYTTDDMYVLLPYRSIK
jgi:hypothetical protein